jgi:hypothetical protein
MWAMGATGCAHQHRSRHAQVPEVDAEGLPTIWGGTIMKRVFSVVLAALAIALGLPATAMAQSGHFVGTPTCTDQGLTVECKGKVAGLGGTTFEITVDAVGIASVECTNPGGNVAPGQDTTVNTSGTTGEQSTPRNGQYRFTGSTEDPGPLPSTPTCPNDKWTADIVDVEFTTATITLLEDGVVADTITVSVA